jgi:outer membrane biogenesis lipoprotein LolB
MRNKKRIGFILASGAALFLAACSTPRNGRLETAQFDTSSMTNSYPIQNNPHYWFDGPGRLGF